MIKWIQTSRLSIKNSLSLGRELQDFVEMPEDVVKMVSGGGGK